MIRRRLLLAAIAALAGLILSHQAHAIENYQGSVIAKCNPGSGANVSAIVTAPHWFVTGLSYTFVSASNVVTLPPKTIVTNKFAQFTVPAGSYTVYVANVPGPVTSTNTPGYQAKYQITAVACGMGSITVRKTILPGAPVAANTAFPVKITCVPSGPVQTVVLNSGNGFTQSVMVPIGKTCTILELPPPPPVNCSWQIGYPQGNTVHIAGQMGYLKRVSNRLVCAPPPGSAPKKR